MKKKSGFVLFETLIVSTLVLGTLIFLYVQITSIKNSYNESFTYNTIPGLYNANVLADYLEKTGYNDMASALGDNSYIDITNCVYASTLCTDIVNKMNVKVILFTHNDITTLKNDITSSDLDKKFIKYIKKLPNTKENGNYRLIVEYNNNTYASVIVNDDITQKLKYSITNIINNSGFENGTNNWTLNNNNATISAVSTIKKTGSNSMSFDINNNSDSLYQSINIKNGHRYYMREHVYLKNKLNSSISNLSQLSGTSNIGVIGLIDENIADSYNVLNNVEAKKWTEIDNLFVASADKTTKYYSIYASATNNNVIYIDNVILIDLTATFGNDNLPDIEWCRRNIDYFEGTSYIYK